jgi:enoyl-[acyl-carrier-protein] reductase (NADH)
MHYSIRRKRKLLHVVLSASTTWASPPPFAHDAARLITGETLYVDGGYHIMD